MLKSLRRRLVLSHILPFLIAMPLTGIALISVLENQVLLPAASDEAVRESLLLADMGQQTPEIWRDAVAAQAFVAEANRYVPARVAVLDVRGQLLAASESAQAGAAGDELNPSERDNVLAGQSRVRTGGDPYFEDSLVDVWSPARDSGGRPLGFVHITRDLPGAYAQFVRLRYFIGLILLLGLLFGTIVGSGLALNLERPLRYITQAVSQLSFENPQKLQIQSSSAEIDRLVRALNAQAERLDRLEQDRRLLLANLIHELSRPITAFQLGIQSLSDEPNLNAELRELLLAGMGSQAARLRRVLEDLGQLNSPAAKSKRLIIRPMPLGPWINSFLAPWRQVAIDKGLSWEVDLPPDLPIVQADPDRLGQVLGNLVSNAIKFTGPGGRVSIQAGRESESVRISVADTGIGIPPEKQPYLFSSPPASTLVVHSSGGMGLGLSIVREWVAAHHGDVTFTSTLGSGTRFTLRLPLRQPLSDTLLAADTPTL